MTIRSGALSHNTSTANSGQLNPIDKPAGLVDGDALIAFIVVPTLAGTNSVVTGPGGWTVLDHFHAPGSGAIGVSVAVLTKPIPSVSAEVATNYSFTATNIAAARPIGIIQALSGRDLTALGSGPKASLARSTSTTATPTGSISPTGDDWDVLYMGATRSNNTFTGTDTELDDYNPAANTSAALYGLSAQPAGTYSKTVTASTASGTGLGLIVAIPKYVAPAVVSPIKRIVGGVPVEVDMYRITGGVPVKLVPVSFD